MTDPVPARVATSHCPICGRQTEARYRPFCSKRCADVDLNRWLGGAYRVPTEEPPPEGYVPEADEER